MLFNKIIIIINQTYGGWRFSKCYDYKQFNIILIIVGYLFGCLVWFILDVYNLNPVLSLFGLEFKSLGLVALVVTAI